MANFRYRTATLVGNWCESEDEAMEEAARARQAHRTEDQGWCWIVPGSIEERQAEPQDSRVDTPASWERPRSG